MIPGASMYYMVLYHNAVLVPGRFSPCLRNLLNVRYILSLYTAWAFFFLFFWEFPAEWALGLFVPSWSLSGGWCACLFASAWSMGLRSDWGTSFSRRVSMQPYVHKGSPSRYRSGWVDWNTGHVTSWKGRTLLEALRSSYICICASYAYSYLLQGAIVVWTKYCY